MGNAQLIKLDGLHSQCKLEREPAREVTVATESPLADHATSFELVHPLSELFEILSDRGIPRPAASENI